MEVKFDHEPNFEQFAMLDESGQCCYLCEDGQKVFQQLVDHFRENHFEDFLQLPSDSITQLCLCPDAIQLQFQLINHLLSKSLINFKNSSNLTENSSAIENFQCESCPRTFSSVQSLKNHFDLTHEASNPFKCKICNFGHFKSQKDLEAHSKVHEEKLKTDKKCPKCDKKCQNDLQLYHHMLVHRERKLECDHCGMKFNMKNSLLRHIMTHFKTPRDKSKDKKTLCQYCSRLISFYNLKRHIRTSHSSNKNIYKCDFEGCGKAFTEMQTLKDHKNLHYGLKPYICEFCSMTFPHIATLRRHRLRHTDPEKYKCQTCSECFVTKKSLTNHIQRQHNDIGNDSKPFACDFEGCTSTFKYEEYLQNHKRDVHVKKRNRVRK